MSDGSASVITKTRRREARHRFKLSAGVAQCRSKPGGKTGLEPGEPTARRRPERFVEILDARQPDALAPIGSEGKKRDRIVRRVKRVAKQRDGQALHFEYACFPRRFPKRR